MDYIKFQSHNGLILIKSCYIIRPCTNISIPQWSDFNYPSQTQHLPYKNISIPQWSDFNFLDT